VCGDRLRLVEVVQNLLDNAAKFMGDQREPTIEVGTRGRDGEGRHILYVRDNGMGIPEDQQDRIFGLFNKLSADADGTGVGLTLVRRIVEVHGGTVRVESPGSGCGRGATFVLTLPPG
jgi:chemotaxis family two-component system sensor kinase Cph1